MEVEKSLVYFFSCLKKVTIQLLKKLFRLPAIKRFEEDEELLKI